MMSKGSPRAVASVSLVQESKKPGVNSFPGIQQTTTGFLIGTPAIGFAKGTERLVLNFIYLLYRNLFHYEWEEKTFLTCKNKL